MSAASAGIKDAVKHNNLGIKDYTAGKYESAAKHFQESLDADKQFAPAHFNMGLALADQGKEIEARQHLTEAATLLATTPTRPSAGSPAESEKEAQPVPSP